MKKIFFLSLVLFSLSLYCIPTMYREKATWNFSTTQTPANILTMNVQGLSTLGIYGVNNSALKWATDGANPYAKIQISPYSSALNSTWIDTGYYIVPSTLSDWTTVISFTNNTASRIRLWATSFSTSGSTEIIINGY